MLFLILFGSCVLPKLSLFRGRNNISWVSCWEALYFQYSVFSFVSQICSLPSTKWLKNWNSRLHKLFILLQKWDTQLRWVSKLLMHYWVVSIFLVHVIEKLSCMIELSSCSANSNLLSKLVLKTRHKFFLIERQKICEGQKFRISM